MLTSSEPRILKTDAPLRPCDLQKDKAKCRLHILFPHSAWSLRRKKPRAVNVLMPDDVVASSLESVFLVVFRGFFAAVASSAAAPGSPTFLGFFLGGCSLSSLFGSASASAAALALALAFAFPFGAAVAFPFGAAVAFPFGAAVTPSKEFELSATPDPSPAAAAAAGSSPAGASCPLPVSALDFGGAGGGAASISGASETAAPAFATLAAGCADVWLPAVAATTLGAPSAGSCVRGTFAKSLISFKSAKSNAISTFTAACTPLMESKTFFKLSSVVLPTAVFCLAMASGRA